MRRLSAILAVLVLCLVPAGVAKAQYAMDIGNLMASIQVGDLNEAVEGVHSATTVYVVRVSRLAGYEISRERLSRVVATRGGVLRYFRAAIRGARVAMKALEVHGQTLDQVIFATFTKDRTATLYIDDRH